MGTRSRIPGRRIDMVQCADGSESAHLHFHSTSSTLTSLFCLLNGIFFFVVGVRQSSTNASEMDHATPCSVPSRFTQLHSLSCEAPKKDISISMLWGYPYLIGLHYKGGLYGISLSLFLLMCIFGALALQDWRTFLGHRSRAGMSSLRLVLAGVAGSSSCDCVLNYALGTAPTQEQ